MKRTQLIMMQNLSLLRRTAQRKRNRVIEQDGSIAIIPGVVC